MPLGRRQLEDCAWLHTFPPLSLCPPYPRLLFPPTLPIILDVITHDNVTHKGERPLRLQTDLSLWRTLLSAYGKKRCLESFSDDRQISFFSFFATFTSFFFFQRADYFLADMRKLATFSPTIWCHFKAEDYLLEQLHNTGDKMYLKTLRNTLGDLSSHTNSYISDTGHLYQPTTSHQTSLCFLLLAPPTTDNQSSLGRAAFWSRLPQTALTKTFLIWRTLRGRSVEATPVGQVELKADAIGSLLPLWLDGRDGASIHMGRSRHFKSTTNALSKTDYNVKSEQGAQSSS